MGFFSQECEGCHRSILAPYVATAANEWQNHATVISSAGTIVAGRYDGYGRLVLDTDYNFDDPRVTPDTYVEDAIGETGPDGPTVWHTACWQLAGCPSEYRGPSAHAFDQGYWIDAADYDRSDPRLVWMPAPFRRVLRFAQLVRHFDSTRPSAN